LGAAQFAQGKGVDAALALPLYLRDKVALKTSERTK
jgi:tRNA threonylcarbamoyladenosine biosynthesis protein TsaB